MVTRIVLVAIALGLLCLCVVVLLFVGSDRIARRGEQAADPVEQAYADNGFAYVEPAPADDELPTVDEADVRSLLVEIYKAQTRARFKGIYGEDEQR